MTDSDRLYRINDEITLLADEFDARPLFADDDEYDAALNEATHLVATVLRIVPSGGANEVARRAEQVVWRITAAAADALAGRRVTDDELARIERALAASSATEVAGDVVAVVTAGPEAPLP